LSIVEQVEAMIAGGARLVQLRHKQASDGEFRRLAKECRERCHAGGATFIVNDRAAIAAEVDADGLHLGQGDLSPTEARRLLGEEKVIGLSTHNREQFRAALDEPVDYIAVGPVFATSTKRNADPAVGLELVEEAALELDGDHRPLVLIGGITLENLWMIRAVTTTAFVASIGGVLRAPSITERVREWRRVLGAR
jgi:thiamine-phosphate pyrophosphorylase